MADCYVSVTSDSLGVAGPTSFQLSSDGEKLKRHLVLNSFGVINLSYSCEESDKSLSEKI